MNLTKAKKAKYDRLPIMGVLPKSEKEEGYLREIKNYEFRHIENPSLSMKFAYGNTKIEHKFLFFDSGAYTVPRHVARHVELCATPRYEWRPNGEGQMIKYFAGTTPRFQMRELFS